MTATDRDKAIAILSALPFRDFPELLLVTEALARGNDAPLRSFALSLKYELSPHAAIALSAVEALGEGK